MVLQTILSCGKCGVVIAASQRRKAYCSDCYAALTAALKAARVTCEYNLDGWNSAADERDVLEERVKRLEEVVLCAAGLAESGPWDSGADYERNRQQLLEKCRNLQPAPPKSMVRYVHTCGLEEEYEDTGQTGKPNCPEMGVGPGGKPCEVRIVRTFLGRTAAAGGLSVPSKARSR